MENPIARIALPVRLRRFFDYSLPETPEPLKPGIRIKVPFKKRELTGILIETTDNTAIKPDKLKAISAIIDQEPIIPTDLLQLFLWAADYYHYPIGEIILGSLPKMLKTGKNPKLSPEKISPKNIINENHLILNNEQKFALDSIKSHLNTFQVFLLQGITGSGKTEIYLQTISEIINNNQQVLILVPEIGLTPQTLERFQKRFPEKNLVTIHSGMSEKERRHSWLAIKNNHAQILIGTRSALFAPFMNLGGIIIDEEHDTSYKQQDNFRYNARDAAIMRAYINRVPIVLGSATPSIESFYNLKLKGFKHLLLKERAGNATKPEFQIIDIRGKQLEQGFSQNLLTEIKLHLSQKNQVMLFLNRRGFAPVLMCHECGWIVVCHKCDARMTYHHATAKLQCHHCDAQKKIMMQCEKGHKNLIPIGLGTERLELTLKKYFPESSIIRIDRDTTRTKNSFTNILDAINAGTHNILIGTQMLAKGHHFPNVTLVGIIDADGGFFSSDFRSLEKMGQLILQVAGRAGRADKPGKVLIQTHYPDHPLLQKLLSEPYEEFANTILHERLEAKLPPTIFYALFRAEAYAGKEALKFLQEIKKILNPAPNKVEISGPIFATQPRRSNRYRAQLLIQSVQRPLLQTFLKTFLPEIERIPTKKNVRWSLDIDPLEIF